MARHDGNDGLGPEGSYYEAKAREEERARRQKGDAMYPLVVTAIYLVLGVIFGLWHPGWLIFLTIPLRYMHFNSRLEQFTNPVMVTLIYLALGCFFNLWHPGWLIFLVIPFGNGVEREVRRVSSRNRTPSAPLPPREREREV